MTVMQEFKDVSLDMTVLEFKKLFLSQNVWARKSFHYYPAHLVKATDNSAKSVFASASTVPRAHPSATKLKSCHTTSRSKKVKKDPFS